MTSPPGEITRLLAGMKLSGTEAVARLMPLVYRELRQLAGRYMRDERVGHTLQPTALVHEVFLRLMGQERANWQCRAHFIAVAAQLMRRILVDYARRRSAAKRGGAAVTLSHECNVPGGTAVSWEELLAIDEVLARLARFDPRKARIVEMRYFGGLSVEETAEALGVSARTVKADWRSARAWMHAELAERIA